MSFDLLKTISEKQKKPSVLDIRSGDSVKVFQKIKEGGKFRIQVFEGVVINITRKDSATARFTVRKVTSGVGVEKSYLLHSPLIDKIEIVARGKVRRNYLSFLRNRSGKSARLTGKAFDHAAVNTLAEVEVEAPEVATESSAAAAETPAEPATAPVEK
jgi:large subunit ribosomal protein L19